MSSVGTENSFESTLKAALSANAIRLLSQFRACRNVHSRGNSWTSVVGDPCVGPVRKELGA
jgi:hypothetical protein